MGTFARDLDVVGNFARGQETTLRRRWMRQRERAFDYELAKQGEGMAGRRGEEAREQERLGGDPFIYDDFETNQDPLFQRLGKWWKNRKKERVTPSTEEAQGRTEQADRAIEVGYQGAEDTARDTGRAIEAGDNAYDPYRHEWNTYRNGGRVGAGAGVSGPVAIHAPRRRSARSAVAPRAYNKGGYVNPVSYADGGEVEDDSPWYERAGRYLREEKPLHSAVDYIVDKSFPRTSRQWREGGEEIAADVEGWADMTAEQRGAAVRNVTYETGENAVQLANAVAGDVLAPADPLIRGIGGFLGFDGGERQPGEPGQAITETPPPEESLEELTEDEQVARGAIEEGIGMAQVSAEENKPPGAIDFSKVDFEAGDIPNMPVTDWIDYRRDQVQNLMLQGASAQQANDEVTTLQQQGFIDYSQQAIRWLEGGNAPAAASAMRMAYQYFPNGSDIKIGMYTDPETGQPSLLGTGFNEETGEPVGNPMLLNSERISVLIENFSDPNAFRSWTKDWRDEQFKREIHEEIDKPLAQSLAQYRADQGSYYRDRGRADLIDAATGDSGIENLKEASKVFNDHLGLMFMQEPEHAEYLWSVMTRIKQQHPDTTAAVIVEGIMEADRLGTLEEKLAQLGIY